MTGNGNILRPLARLAAILSLCVLTGCMGIHLDTVNRADPAAVPAGSALVVGRIRHVVDGTPMQYGLLDKPTLQLFRRGDASYHASPEVGADGHFAWALPPGEYGVAVLFGGLPPPGVPHLMTTGQLVRVNGIVDPGLEFRAVAGQVVYLGTIEVAVRSRMTSALLGGRVFGTLDGITVIDERRAAGDAFPALRDAPVGAPALRVVDGARRKTR